MKSRSVEETKERGREFVARLHRGDVVLLQGELGAGKTTFVQGMAEGLGIPPTAYVRSPTFSLIHEYPGDIPLYHLDLYRLDRWEELRGLGCEEYFEKQGITVVEWGDKFPDWLPTRTVKISFSVLDEHTREIVVPC